MRMRAVHFRSGLTFTKKYIIPVKKIPVTLRKVLPELQSWSPIRSGIHKPRWIIVGSVFISLPCIDPVPRFNRGMIGDGTYFYKSLIVLFYT